MIKSCLVTALPSAILSVINVFGWYNFRMGARDEIYLSFNEELLLGYIARRKVTRKESGWREVLS